MNKILIAICLLGLAISAAASPAASPAANQLTTGECVKRLKNELGHIKLEHPLADWYKQNLMEDNLEEENLWDISGSWTTTKIACDKVKSDVEQVIPRDGDDICGKMFYNNRKNSFNRHGTLGPIYNALMVCDAVKKYVENKEKEEAAGPPSTEECSSRLSSRLASIELHPTLSPRHMEGMRPDNMEKGNFEALGRRWDYSLKLECEKLEKDVHSVFKLDSTVCVDKFNDGEFAEHDKLGPFYNAIKVCAAVRGYVESHPDVGN